MTEYDDLADVPAVGNPLDHVPGFEPDAGQQDKPQKKRKKQKAAASDGGARQEDERKKPDKSQASEIVETARERYRLLMSPEGRPYAVAKDGANIAFPLRGKGGLRVALAKQYFAGHRKAASQSALTDAGAVLEGYAQEEDPEPVHLRMGRHDDRIVIDMGDTTGRCITVGPDGWQVATRSPVLFRRTKTTGALPYPVHDGDGFTKLSTLLNTTTRNVRLIWGTLIATCFSDIPRAAPLIRGEQGTAKSTFARMLTLLLDPSPSPLRKPPRDSKQWTIAASTSYVVCLDNLSAIPPWLSDDICRGITGEASVDRELYSDDDVVVIAFRRMVILVGIEVGAIAGDLADRVLPIELDVIPEEDRKEDAQVQAAFADAHPAILASLLDDLSAVLKALPDVRPARLPRMADYARVLAALDHVKGWDTLGTYRSAMNLATASVLDGDQFAQAVIDLVEHSGKWEGLTSQLLELLPTPKPRPKSWPADATRASGHLKRIAPALRSIGIEAEQLKHTKRGTPWRITATENTGKTASPASPASPGMSDLRKHGDAEGDAAQPASPASPSASPGDHASDLVGYPTGDAGEAGDAEIHLLSDDPYLTEPVDYLTDPEDPDDERDWDDDGLIPAAKTSMRERNDPT